MERHVYPWTIVAVNYHYNDPPKQVDLVQSGHLIIISSNVTCSRHDIAEQILDITTITHSLN